MLCCFVAFAMWYGARREQRARDRAADAEMAAVASAEPLRRAMADKDKSGSDEDDVHDALPHLPKRHGGARGDRTTRSSSLSAPLPPRYTVDDAHVDLDRPAREFRRPAAPRRPPPAIVRAASSPSAETDRPVAPRQQARSRSYADNEADAPFTRERRHPRTGRRVGHDRIRD